MFDIDPYIYSGKEAKGAEPELNTVAFEKGKEVAFWLRELLLGMSLEAIVKTSGKTGLHVFVPIRRTIDFDAARQVSELVGRHLMRQHPKDITMEWSVPKRTGKIFMDYNMNVRGKTLERRVFSARRTGRTGVDAADLGRTRRRAPPRLSPDECDREANPEWRSLAQRSKKQAESGAGAREKLALTHLYNLRCPDTPPGIRRRTSWLLARSQV